MSEIYQTLKIDEWAKIRMEHLQRINHRITDNLRKYQERKTRDSRESTEERDSKKSQGQHEIKKEKKEQELGLGLKNESMRDFQIVISQQRQIYQREMIEYDEIAHDWRRLNDTITNEIPQYMGSSSSKVLKKINTVKNEAARIAKKIEMRLQEEDLKEYRFNQGQKKWKNQIKSSIIREAHPDTSSSYDSFDNTEKEKPQKGKGSTIMDSLMNIGKDVLNTMDKQLMQNEELVDEYQEEKKQQRLFTKVLLGFILAMLLISWTNVQLHTNSFQWVLGFVDNYESSV